MPSAQTRTESTSSYSTSSRALQFSVPETQGSSRSSSHRSSATPSRNAQPSGRNIAGTEGRKASRIPTNTQLSTRTLTVLPEGYDLPPEHDRGHTGLCVHFTTFGVKYRTHAPPDPAAQTIYEADCTQLPLPSKHWFKDPSVYNVYLNTGKTIAGWVDGMMAGRRQGCVTVVVKSVYGIIRSYYVANQLSIDFDKSVKCYMLELDKDTHRKPYNEDDREFSAARLDAAPLPPPRPQGRAPSASRQTQTRSSQSSTSTAQRAPSQAAQRALPQPAQRGLIMPAQRAPSQAAQRAPTRPTPRVPLQPAHGATPSQSTTASKRGQHTHAAMTEDSGFAFTQGRR